jgi:hypothetical protein
MTMARQDDVVTMTANGDVYPSATATEKPNSGVCNVKLSGAAAGKTYTIRRTGSGGGILWTHIAGATPAELVSEPVQFRVGPGLYLETDNTSNPTFKLLLMLC